MAPPKITDYELKRLENIRRNNEMMAELKLQSKASQFFNCNKVVTKSKTVKSEKKPKTETPTVIRRSLRNKNVDSNILSNNSNDFFRTLDSISMKDAYQFIDDSDSDRSFIESLVGMSNKELSDKELKGTAKKKKKNECSFELESLSLNPENITHVVRGRITHLKFLPSNDVNMIVAGSRFGDIGFWNVGQSEVFLYHSHPSKISGISLQPHCLSKIYTSCHDGFVRMMDAEKEVFDTVYKSSDGKHIFALAQPKNDTNCLYLAEGYGCLTVLDNRIGKCSSPSHLTLNRNKIKTIDFHPENPHIAVTSSADGTACTWDFRCTGDRDNGNITALKTFTYEKGLQSAYFSPSGCSIAVTSDYNTVGIHSGVNLEDAAFVYLESIQSLYLYRAIWGWDDSHLFIGCDKRGVGVVSTAQNATMMTLESPLISTIPIRFDAHSYKVGMLAGGSNRGHVYVWTSSQDLWCSFEFAVLQHKLLIGHAFLEYPTMISFFF